MLVFSTAAKLRQSLECSVYSGMTVASSASEKKQHDNSNKADETNDFQHRIEEAFLSN